MAGTPDKGRVRRTPRPLDAAALEEAALAYVARFATTQAKLRQYLARKLRERGWEGDSAPDPDALVERLDRLGYVDDAAYAKARSNGLLRRGYGARRVSQALGAAGVAAEISDGLRPPEAQARAAALALARKRGFGPFGAVPPDRERREKQIAAMLRAGHPLDSARELVDSPDVESALGWVAEAQDAEEHD